MPDDSSKEYQTNISLLNKLNADGTTVRASAWTQFRKLYAPIIAMLICTGGPGRAGVRNDRTVDALAMTSSPPDRR